MVRFEIDNGPTVAIPDDAKRMKTTTGWKRADALALGDVVLVNKIFGMSTVTTTPVVSQE